MTRIAAIWAALIVASIALVACRSDEQPTEWWGEQVEITACDIIGWYRIEASEKGCGVLRGIIEERDGLRVELDAARQFKDAGWDLAAELGKTLASLPLTSCLEQQRRYDARYWSRGEPPPAGGHHENLLRRECKDAEAARFIEATTRERPDWAPSGDLWPAATATPEPDKCSGRGLSTKEYARCRCAESGGCR